MFTLPPRVSRTDTLLPDTTLVRSQLPGRQRAKQAALVPQEAEPAVLGADLAAAPGEGAFHLGVEPAAETRLADGLPRRSDVGAVIGEPSGARSHLRVPGGRISVDAKMVVEAPARQFTA